MPREGEVYRPMVGELREVLIDHVTEERVLLRVTDGQGGLLAARSLTLADWDRIRDSHELSRVESGCP